MICNPGVAKPLDPDLMHELLGEESQDGDQHPLDGLWSGSLAQVRVVAGNGCATITDLQNEEASSTCNLKLRVSYCLSYRSCPFNIYVIVGRLFPLGWTVEAPVAGLGSGQPLDMGIQTAGSIINIKHLNLSLIHI